jgi:HlyD family secretion protein
MRTGQSKHSRCSSILGGRCAGNAHPRVPPVWSGTLNTTTSVEVGSQLSGQIVETFVDFNDTVTKGQPLARLDEHTFKAKVEEAEAALGIAKVSVATARARVERAQLDVRDTEVQRGALKARTEAARVNLEAARNAQQRKELLQERGVGTPAILEDARTRTGAATAAVGEAEALQAAQNYKVAAANADLHRAQSELETAIALVRQREALLQIARIDLDRTIIRSPIDGVVVGRDVNVGQTLATTMEARTVFIIAGDLRKMDIHAKVDEADIGKIRVGQDAVFTVDAYPGRQFTAKVKQVRKAPQEKQNVVTYTVVLSAANEQELLLPGMTASVRIKVTQTGPILKLPIAALRFKPLGKSQQNEGAASRPGSIWVLGTDGRPKHLSVEVGEEDASYAELLSGPLHKGDAVIVGDAPPLAPKRLFGIRIGL